MPLAHCLCLPVSFSPPSFPSSPQENALYLETATHARSVHARISAPPAPSLTLPPGPRPDCQSPQPRRPQSSPASTAATTHGATPPPSPQQGAGANAPGQGVPSSGGGNATEGEARPTGVAKAAKQRRRRQRQAARAAGESGGAYASTDEAPETSRSPRPPGGEGDTHGSASPQRARKLMGTERRAWPPSSDRESRSGGSGGNSTATSERLEPASTAGKAMLARGKAGTGSTGPDEEEGDDSSGAEEGQVEEEMEWQGGGREEEEGAEDGGEADEDEEEEEGGAEGEEDEDEGRKGEDAGTSGTHACASRGRRNPPRDTSKCREVGASSQRRVPRRSRSRHGGAGSLRSADGELTVTTTTPTPATSVSSYSGADLTSASAFAAQPPPPITAARLSVSLRHPQLSPVAATPAGFQPPTGLQPPASTPTTTLAKALVPAPSNASPATLLAMRWPLSPLAASGRGGDGSSTATVAVEAAAATEAMARELAALRARLGTETGETTPGGRAVLEVCNGDEQRGKEEGRWGGDGDGEIN